jgi:threonine/homoserine/homoserine lactone efflux protein
MWIGIETLTRSSSLVDGTAALATVGDRKAIEGSWQRQALKGAGVSGLNPKLLPVFLALLPQFTDPHAPWPITVQIATLGLIMILLATALLIDQLAG